MHILRIVLLYTRNTSNVTSQVKNVNYIKNCLNYLKWENYQSIFVNFSSLQTLTGLCVLKFYYVDSPWEALRGLCFPYEETAIYGGEGVQICGRMVTSRKWSEVRVSVKFCVEFLI